MSKLKPLELYIHIPFCEKKCDYCDFLSFKSTKAARERYVKALTNEIIFYGKSFSSCALSSIYIGGGTPSCLEVELVEKIMEAVHASFKIYSDCEVSMEVNPGTVSKNVFDRYKDAGINRISIGLQSANDDELKLLGRIHDFDKFVRTYEFARRAGFENINVDIMYALPGQSVESLSQTLEKVYTLRPEHISAYSLIIEEGTPFYERYSSDATDAKKSTLPTEEEEVELADYVTNFMESHGFHRYEISNYAKEGYECRHNIGYWERKNYIGVGLGASSLIDDDRFTNTRDISSYINNWRESDVIIDETFFDSVEKLSKKDAVSEFMFLGLRKTDGISKADFYDAFLVSVESYYADVIEKYKSQGFLIEEEGRLFLSKKGLDVSNVIMADFLL